MKVSILIPAYKEGALLIRAVQSCLEQNYPDHEVVVGLESEDAEGLNLLRTDAAIGSRARVIEFSRRTSVCAKINAMLSECSGDIVVKMDADMVWGNPSCLDRLVDYFADPEVGGVSLVGDRGLKGYAEIFAYVTDPLLRKLVVHERSKSLFARAESAVERMVSKFREGFFPIRGAFRFPMDIHSFRRALIKDLDEDLVHDDAQIFFQVLAGGKSVVLGKDVTLLHLGAPTTASQLHRQKAKGRAGWRTLRRKYGIRMGGYYLKLLLFMVRNLRRLSWADMSALVFWLAFYTFSTGFSLLTGSARRSGIWKSPR